MVIDVREEERVRERKREEKWEWNDNLPAFVCPTYTQYHAVLGDGYSTIGHCHDISPVRPKEGRQVLDVRNDI